MTRGRDFSWNIWIYHRESCRKGPGKPGKPEKTSSKQHSGDTLSIFSATYSKIPMVDHHFLHFWTLFWSKQLEKHQKESEKLHLGGPWRDSASLLFSTRACQFWAPGARGWRATKRSGVPKMGPNGPLRVPGQIQTINPGFNSWKKWKSMGYRDGNHESEITKFCLTIISQRYLALSSEEFPSSVGASYALGNAMAQGTPLSLKGGSPGRQRTEIDAES